MNKQNSLITRYCLAVVVMLALLGPLAQKGRGDFVLIDNQQLTVNSSHNQGTLFDTSRAFIVPGGYVYSLYAYDSGAASISGGFVRDLYTCNFSDVDISSGNVNNLYAHDFSDVDISGGYMYSLDARNSSTVSISGGNVGGYGDGYLYAYDSSTVDVSGGYVYGLSAYNFSTVNISGGTISYLYNASSVSISGGSVGTLYAYDSSTVSISGGSITYLYAYDFGMVTFYGQNFHIGDGLSFDGERVLGTGMLSGEWMDGTRWAVNVADNYPTATILAIPETATFLLLFFGAVMLRRQHKNGLIK